MFNFIFKSSSFSHLRHSITTIPPKHYHLQLLSFSISSSSSSENPQTDDFTTVHHLITKYKYSPKIAFSVSKYFDLDKADDDHHNRKPAAVISLLKELRFDDTQISELVTTRPSIMSDPKNTLLPPINFLLSQGVKGKKLAKIVYKTNLHPDIIPSFTSLKELLGPDHTTRDAIVRCPKLLTEFHRSVAPNVEILRNAGVPEDKFTSFLEYPKMFLRPPPTFKENVENVVKMGFDSSKSDFVVAVRVLGSHPSSFWEKKIEFFKELGCSDDDVFEAFKVNPRCINMSEKEIKDVMNFFANEMGWDSSSVMRCSYVFSMCMGGEIIPRCAVYRVLLSDGLIKEGTDLHKLFTISDSELEKYVKPYAETENNFVEKTLFETVLMSILYHHGKNWYWRVTKLMKIFFVLYLHGKNLIRIVINLMKKIRSSMY